MRPSCNTFVAQYLAAREGRGQEKRTARPANGSQNLGAAAVTTAPHSPPSLGDRRHRSRRLAAIPSAASVVRPGLNAPPTSPTSLSPGGVTGSSSLPISLPTRPKTRPVRPLADAYGRALSLPVAAMREAGEATGGEEGEGHHQEAQRLPAARGDSLSTRRSARSSDQFGSTYFLLSEFHL